MSTQECRIVSAEDSDIHDEPHIEGSRVTVWDIHARVEMLNAATSASHYHSHTTVAQPAAVGMSPRDSLRGGCNGESGRWPGPLLTMLDARECHSPPGRATPSRYATRRTLR